jgi:autotransporter-associated beta strand protein
MGFFSWRQWLNRKSRLSRRFTSFRPHKSFRPLELETLEDRLAPATDIWSGLGADTNWKTAANWSNGTPNPGDDLEFPSGVPATSRTNFNNLAAGTVFNSITFAGGSYTLLGNQIVLGGPSGGHTLIANSSTLNNVIQLDIQMGATAGNQEFFTENFGASLTLAGHLTGSGVDLTKDGTGTLVLSNNNSGFTNGPIAVAQGILQITNAKALGNGVQPTTVDTGAQLQLNNVAGPIAENLILNGPGAKNDGALLNVDGANVWSGTISLDSDSSIGASTGALPGSSVLNITGTIGDLTGHSLTKQGAGQVIFSSANTYRGTTTINNGILTIRNASALGDITSSQVTTLVNSTLTGSGTLQIEDPTGAGFVVKPYPLTLNGAGFNGIGALDSLNGNNTWSGNVTLGSPSPNGSNVSIGVESQGVPAVPTNLLISGVIGDPPPAAGGPFNLTKVGTGRLIFTNSNTYLGTTTVAVGILNIEDSQALGPQTKVNGTTVLAGAALELEIQKDNRAGLVPNPAPDSITGTLNTMDFLQAVSINATGINGTGALHSISGINVWNGTIALVSPLASIGVDPDPNASSSNSYFPVFNSSGLPISGDFSLTVVPNAGNGGAGIITGPRGTTFQKADGGQLILPTANAYFGPTDIQQGWITIQNNQSLGARTPRLGDTAQPITTVEAGAALHLKSPTPGGTLTVPNNFILAGLGINHPFALISQQGALMNLDGLNTLTGNIQLNGTAGIGVEQVDTTPPPIQSELTLIGEILDASTAPPGGGSLVKLGSKRLVIQGDGAYSGTVDIRQGVILDQNSSGLGIDGGGSVTVENGAALELQTGVAALNGGIAAGLEIWGKSLILNGTGNTSYTGTLIQPLTSLAADNMWRGSVSLSGSTTIDVEANSRLTLYGPIDDAANPLATGSDLTKVGTGELNLAGTNTYRGHTFVSQGIVAVQSGQALGTTAVPEIQKINLPGTGPGSFTMTFGGQTTVSLANSASAAAVQNALDGLSTIGGAVGGFVNVALANNVLTITFLGNLTGYQQGLLSATGSGGGSTVATETQVGTGGAVVANGASLELQGNITVAGKPLEIQGTGVAAVPSVPVNWFQQGPAPILQGATPGNQPVSGRVTGVATDPSDANVIYISTAGGGAWKTEDGGLTWVPLFDAPNAIFSGAIAVAPSDPRVIYLGTGEADNSFDSFYGTGVYKSTDSGRTWTLLTDSIGNPLYGKAVSKIIVDPNNSSLIYVADSDLATNGTSGDGDPGSPARLRAPGVWRFDGTSWFNLTDKVSFNRATNKGNQTAPPDTPGPDDDYRIVFPQLDATWSDLGLDANGVLFAALGTATGSSDNAVFRNENPQSNTPIWYVGPGDKTPGSPDGESSSEFPTPFSVGGRNPAGNIKIGVASPPGPTGPPNSNTVIYAALTTAVAPAGNLFEIEKSTDGGATWALIGAPPDYMGGQGNYDSAFLAINPNTLYIGGHKSAPGPFNDEIYVNTFGGGGIWTDISADANGNGPHDAAHALAVDALGRVLVGTDGGMWRYDPRSNPAAWTDVNGNLAITQLNSVSLNPSDPSSAFGGSRNNGAEMFSGPAAGSASSPSWTLVDFQNGLDSGLIRIDQQNPNNVYHAEDGILYKSTAGGVSGSFSSILSVNPGNPSSFPFVIDSVNTSRIVVGGPNVLQESFDGGNTWIPSLNVPAASITSVALATNQGPFLLDKDFPLVTDQLANTYDPNTIYVIANNQVFVTKNQGTSWVNRTAGIPAGAGKLVDIEVDPRDRDTAYVVAGGLNNGSKVFMTSNAGRSWTDITPGLPNVPTNKLVIDPRNGNLYVGNDLGVWLSTDGGNTWNRFGAGLPFVQVTDLVLNASLNTLGIATYGRSMYQIWLDDSQANAGALNSVSGSGIWTGPVTLTGDTVIGARGTQAIQDGISTSTLNIVGTIGDLTPAGTSRLTKVGLGDVVLSGANSYGGVTEIQEGVLVVHNPLALGGTANGTIVDAGTALDLQSSVIGEPLDLSGDGLQFNGHNTGALDNVSNNNVYSGPITLETDTTIGVASGSSLTISGSISKDPAVNASAGLTKELTGTLVLTGANSYDGATDINQGVLQIQNSQALGAAGAPTQVMDGSQLQFQTPRVQTVTLSGTTTGSFTLTFNGQATTSLAYGASAAQVAAALNALATIGGVGGFVTVALAGTVYTVTFGGILGTGNQPAMTATGLNGTLAAVNVVFGPPVVVMGKSLTLSGTGIVATGALLNVAGNNTWQGPVILTGVPGFSPPTTPPANVFIDVSNSGDNLTVNGPISEVATTNITDFGLTKIGPGRLILQQADSYTGPTSVQVGVLNIEDSKAVGTSSSSQVTVANGAALELQANVGHVDSITGTANIAPPAALFLNGTGIAPAKLGALRNVGGANTWTGPITLSTTSAIGVDPATQLTVTGGISGTASVNLQKVGTGPLVFTTANGYLGQTQIQAGVLNLRSQGTLGAATGGPATVSSGASLQLQSLADPLPTTKTIQLTGPGFNNQGALENVAGNNVVPGPITLVSDSSIGVDQSTDTLTVSGVIGGGSSGLAKVGPGALQLAGNTANTYTGLTAVNDGVLQLNKTGAIAIDGNLTVGDGVLPGPDVVRLLQSNEILNTAAVTVKSDGLFDLTNQTQTIATLGMTGGTVSLTQAGSQLAVTGAVTASSDSAGNPALISGAGANAGLLVLAPAGAATATTFSETPGGGPVDLLVSAVITGGAGIGLTQAGPGTMALTNTETYPGVTTVSGGTLNVDVPGQIGSVSMNGGTLAGTGTVGTITATNTSGSVVHPGDSPGPGILSASGNVTFNPSTTFKVTLGGSQPGTGYSQMVVNGNVNLGGASLNVVLANSFSPTAGTDSFTILQVTGTGNTISSQFAQGTQAVINGIDYSITYSSTTVVLARVVVGTKTTVTSSVNPSVYGQSVTFTATVSPAVAGVVGPIGGNVVFTIDGTSYPSVALNASDQATFRTSVSLSTPLDVAHSPHSVSVSFTDTDHNFSGSTVTLPNGQTVAKANTTVTVTPDIDPSIYGQTVTYTAVVGAASPGTGVPAGTVSFVIDGKTVASGVTLVNGQAKFQTSSLSTLLDVAHSPHSVTVSFVDSDGNYNNNTGTLPNGQVVTKAGSTITVSSTNNNSVYGEAVITAAVAPQFAGNPTGTVTFTIKAGSTTTTEKDNLSNGTATLQQVLNVGTYLITAAYSGDSNFAVNTSSNQLNQTVNPAGTSTTVTSSATNNTSVYSQPVTFTASVAPQSPGKGTPDGTVDFIIDGSTAAAGVALTGGQATFTIATLTVAGSAHTVQVNYHPGASGDFTASGGSLTGGETVTPASTQTAVTSSFNPSVYGQIVTFTATVSAPPNNFIPNGTVDFNIDGILVGSGVALNASGQAFFPTSNLPAALTVAGSPHTVQATYNPPVNGNFFTSSGTLTGGQTINQDETTTTVSSSASPSTYGQPVPVTFTATVAANSPGAGTATGTVNFFADSPTGTPLGSGTLNQGSPDVASYQTTAIQLQGGSHTIYAVYQGDSNFLGGQGSTLQTVQRATTVTSDVSTTNNASFYGQPITLSASVAATTSGIGVPTGSISFYDGTSLLSSGVVSASGVASINLPSTGLAALAAGSHTISAQYTGDTNFGLSTSPSPQLVQNVAKAITTTAINTNNANAVYGQETITATVVNTSSNITPTGMVTFNISTSSGSLPAVTVALNSSGVATLTSPANVLAELTAGGSSTSYTISAKYLGDSAGNFATSNSTSPASITQTVTKDNSSTALTATTVPPGNNQSVAGQPVTLTAVVSASSSTGLPATGSTVLFFDGASQIGSGTLSLVSGQEQASIQDSGLSVAGSPHTLTAKFLGDANFLTSTSSSVSFTVLQDATTTTVSSSPSTSTYGTPVTLTATVTANAPGGGTPTGTVNFYANTVATGSLLGTGTLNNGLPDVASYTTGSTQLMGSTTSIIAVYQGDTSFSTSQGSAPQTVQQVNTTTSLGSSTTMPVVGHSLTFTATVASIASNVSFDNGGSVVFTVDSAPQPAVPVNSAGQAALQWTFSTPGNHTIGATYSGDTNFAGSPASPLTQNVLTQDAGFVAQVYLDLLNRTVDAPGLAYWSGLLDANVLSRSQFVLQLESSTEYRSDVVDALYVKYLGRHADPGGLSFFVGQMAHGMTDEGVASVLIGSPEFFALSGSTSSNVKPFLTLLYEDALYRQPDQAGLNAFTQALSFNVSRQQVASIVLGSFEYKQDLVGGGPFGVPTVAPGYYNRFLHRNADAAGRDYWAGLMTQGMTDEQVIASIVGSQEYFNNV